VLGRAYGRRRAVGDGGNVRNGRLGSGFGVLVNRGSKSREAGVQRFSKIANASLDPCNEAVVKTEGKLATCRLKSDLRQDRRLGSDGMREILLGVDEQWVGELEAAMRAQRN